MNYMKLAVRRRSLFIPLLFSGSSGPLGSPSSIEIAILNITIRSLLVEWSYYENNSFKKGLSHHSLCAFVNANSAGTVSAIS